MRRMMVIDDDEVSREVLSLLAADAGYVVSSLESGDAAIETLEFSSVPCPDLVLADMRMMGTSGSALAMRLRDLCPSVRLIAMSSREVSAPDFDGFMPKPFTIQALELYLDGRQPESSVDSAVSDSPALDETIYQALRNAMPAVELRRLYALCLDDIGRRIRLMQDARDAGEEQIWTDEAHAIRGSCGFLGALELEKLAATLESEGSSTTASGCARLDVLASFLAAADDLRRILMAHD